MTTSRRIESRYLEMHGASYRVSYPVPKALHDRLGQKRLKKSLHTADLRKANKLKIKVIAEFDELIELTWSRIKLDRATATERGKEIRRILLDPLQDAEGRKSAREDAMIEFHHLLGKPVDYVYESIDFEEIAIPIYDETRAKTADDFLNLVSPDNDAKLDAFVELWLSTKLKDRTERTKEDSRRAVRYVRQWCALKGYSLDVRSFNSVQASDFLDDFEEMSGGLQAVTRAKYLNRLQLLWSRLKHKGWVAENVWADQTVEIPGRNERHLERAFTMDEVRRLLRGGAPEKLRDVMMIGLLTGARLEVIVSLSVGDIKPDRIFFPAAKKEMRDRFVPIHPLLQPILDRRTDGKEKTDDLFPDWPAPKKKGTVRERSFKTSNAFTEFRRQCGVDEVVAGDRRSKVNFHSFRRWFVTHFRRMAPLDMTQAIVGHSHGNTTEDIYQWSGPKFKAAVRYISRLPVPPDTDEYAPDPDGINLYDTELRGAKKKQRRKYK